MVYCEEFYNKVVGKRKEDTKCFFAGVKKGDFPNPSLEEVNAFMAAYRNTQAGNYEEIEKRIEDGGLKSPIRIFNFLISAKPRKERFNDIRRGVCRRYGVESSRGTIVRALKILCDFNLVEKIGEGRIKFYALKNIT